ncbi:acyl-CoA dehydrogenase family protein [Herbiconiux sp. CPCC 203407]|uniref:Acyl-CoA dehydrogenase family protein n=1 Tax=Herbiconiux oxytropis TaxID=2970915 RepID=A0AA42BW71_9MICO|nr:acyl-CoA dehydrogenase family protein [Herbiconiux oxytropis]MCS5721990.1 acyl-CoA dehydrogenase family protein [Herbiconiux oxytropis]MCS5725573.1 acyl-CoA dehydrogenase family protein [Herbiconiux oxytropis]
MTITESATESITSGDDVLRAVERIRGPLRENALRAEAEHRVPDESIDLLEQAGVFRLTAPVGHGGLEAPLTDQVRILSAIGRADLSTAWVCSLHTVGTYFVGHYPDEAQHEVFTSPDARVAAIFSPGGTLTPVEGGYRLSGRWPFNTGCRSAAWDALAAAVDEGTPGAGGPPRMLLPLVRVEDLTIEDDWDPSGLAGTGSNAVVAHDVFVPEHRTLPLMEALGGLNLSEATKDSSLYKAAFFPTVLVNSMGAPVGAAQGALDAFLERLPGRKITYTSWVQAEAQITHVELASAATDIKAAELLRDDLARRLTEAAETGRDLSVFERAEIRGECSQVVRLARRAVRTLFDISSASAIQRSVPIQRIHRDLDALSLHAALAINTNFEVHGRVLAGQDAATPFL